jgi:2-keto-3-deoxy-L-rhamnonate aldolase RhmA
VGITRGQRFDLEFDRYMSSANEEIAVIVQIEHIEAVRNIDAILDTPGIDGVFVGPFDMSGSMDLPGQINHPRVQEAIKSVIEACAERDIARCIYAHTPLHARTYMEQGYRVIGLCTDYIMLARQAADYLKSART